MVTPALHAVAPAWLDPELAEYLAASHGLNELRNRRFLAELEAAGSVLNRLGIEPVALKGAASVLRGLYRNPADRIIRDIDLLVPVQRLDDCVAAFRADGYEPKVRAPRLRRSRPPRSHRHYPFLWREDRLFAVELHSAPVEHRQAAAIPANAVIAAATPVALGGATLGIPCVADQIVHNAIHAHSIDRLTHKRPLSLRQLLEFVLLCRCPEAAAAWPEIVARFHHAGLARHLADHATLAALLIPCTSAARPRAGVLTGVRVAYLLSPPGEAVRRLRQQLAQAQARLLRPAT
jgi:hypothetical protein